MAVVAAIVNQLIYQGWTRKLICQLTAVPWVLPMV